MPHSLMLPLSVNEVYNVDVHVLTVSFMQPFTEKYPRDLSLSVSSSDR